MIWRESSGGDCPMGMSFRGKGVSPSRTPGVMVSNSLAPPLQPDYFVTILYYKEKSNG